MHIYKTKFKDLLIVKQKNNYDIRGNLRETFNNKILKKKFVFEYCTTSKNNVLRGFHFQTKFKQSKYVNVVKGKILDVVIDLRKKSKTFGKTFKIILSNENALGLYIPAGFGHAYYSYDKENIIYYLANGEVDFLKDQMQIIAGIHYNQKKFVEDFFEAKMRKRKNNTNKNNTKTKTNNNKSTKKIIQNGKGKDSLKFKNSDIQLIENSSQDILNATIDLLNYIKSEYQLSELEQQRQNKFWYNFKSLYVAYKLKNESKTNIIDLHGEIKSKIPPSFFDTNKHWLK